MLDKPIQKTKVIATATPIPKPRGFLASGGTSGSSFGELLLRRRKEGQRLILLRRDDQEYFHGLRDAGMYGASEVYDMLCVYEQVEITFETVPDNN